MMWLLGYVIGCTLVQFVFGIVCWLTSFESGDNMEKLAGRMIISLPISVVVLPVMMAYGTHKFISKSFEVAKFDEIKLFGAKEKGNGQLSIPEQTSGDEKEGQE